MPNKTMDMEKMWRHELAQVHLYWWLMDRLREERVVPVGDGYFLVDTGDRDDQETAKTPQTRNHGQ